MKLKKIIIALSLSLSLTVLTSVVGQLKNVEHKNNNIVQFEIRSEKSTNPDWIG